MMALALGGSVACDRERSEGGGWFGAGRAGAAGTSVAEASLDAGGRLDFEVTSDTYRRWMVAQQAIGRSAIGAGIARLGRRALTQRELDDAVRKVEDDAVARAAVENAGMSPREFVYATIAMEQAMTVARGGLAPRRDDGGVAARNAELARRHEAEIMASGTGADTVAMPPGYEPLPLPEPMPSPEPLPVPPLDTSARPRDTTRLPTPAPAQPVPARPSPTQPVPVPVPTPAQPVPARPAPAQPAPTPQPAPPPVDTTRASAR